MPPNLGPWANDPPRPFNYRSYGHPSTVGATPVAAGLPAKQSPQLSVAKSPKCKQSVTLTGSPPLPPPFNQSHLSVAPSTTSSDVNLTSTTTPSHDLARAGTHIEAPLKLTTKDSGNSQDLAIRYALNSPPASARTEFHKASIATSCIRKRSENDTKASPTEQKRLENTIIKSAPHECGAQQLKSPVGVIQFPPNENQLTKPFATSRPRANLRKFRPAPSQYHRQTTKMPRPSLLAPAPSTQKALSDETDEDQLKQIQDLATEAIYSRLNKKNQDKRATTNIALLHEIRKPMTSSKEAWVEDRVDHYRQLGESPLFWTTELVMKIETPEPRNNLMNALDQKTKDTDSSVRRSAKVRNNGWATPSQVEAQQAKMMTRIKSRRNKNWANNSEVRAQRVEVNSNAYGSADPSDTSTEVGDSVQAIDSGSIGRVNRPDPGLVLWNGGFMAPPVDWESRPGLKRKKTNAASEDGPDFLDEIFHQRYPDQLFNVIPTKYVLDVDYHADGISLGPRTWSITMDNMVSYFGYAEDTDLHNFQGFNTTTNDDFDRESTSSNFEESAQNDIGLAETSEVYSQRYLAYINKQIPARAEEPKTVQSEALSKSLADVRAPALSIYLRPATLADIAQITRIYNHYVEHSPYPPDLEPVEEVDIRDNFDDAVRHKLPFVVAVEKKRSRQKKRNSDGMISSTHPIQNTNPNYQALVKEEKIVGFAYAQDWTAYNFCERTSVEMELYVAPESRILGVGTCLMDKMIQICDRGHSSKGGYDFHCLPEKRHLYSEGGGRDLHKVYVCVRTWSRPAKTPQLEAITKRSDREDECELWVKHWLENWGFKQEGHLKEIGARNGRYIDAFQFGRVTMWSPKDGEIPDALPGTT